MDPADFKLAMARFPAGVTIVTTCDADGASWGFTASSFASLSLDPPLVLVCLATDAECAPAFQACERFAISILGTQDAALAMRFASRGVDKFADGGLEPGANGAPVVSSAVAAVACDLEHRYDGGDHVILVGRVVDARTGGGEPLVYADRAFRRLGTPIEV